MADKKSIKDWEASVDKATKGKGVSSLVWKTPEGIDVKPLYTAEDLEKLASDGFDANSLPGFAPFTRGPQSTMYAPICRFLDG